MAEQELACTTPENAKKEKGKKKHKVLKIIGIILAVIAAVAVIIAVLNTITYSGLAKYAESFHKVEYENQLIPEIDKQTGYYTFTTDRDFKVLQITDVHIGGGFLSYSKDKKAINAVTSMITAEKPDMVIFTGDISFPVIFQSGTINNIRPAKLMCSVMEKLGVYWCVCYGNHDTEIYSIATREKISEIYGNDNYKYCLFQSGPADVDGYGNYAVNLKNSKGLITRTYYMLDSHSYVDNDYFGIKWLYDNIHQNQIDWYDAQVKKMNDINASVISSMHVSEAQKSELTKTYGTAKSFCFFHIPLTEYKDVYDTYVKNGYKDSDDIKYIYGAAGEKKKVVYCGVHEDEMFETIKADQSTQGVFCGHDHYNNFSFDYQGIRLTYGCSIDYLAYSGIHKKGSQRGCTVIIAKADTTWDCRAENYYQEKYNNAARETVEMQTLNEHMNGK